MNSCYILFSPSLGRFYVGSTHDSVECRIAKHNTHFYGKTRYTSTVSDWELFLEISVGNYAHAVRLERKIKSMKSSQYIKNLRLYPELVKKIVMETVS
jgi:putative endonuclease